MPGFPPSYTSLSGGVVTLSAKGSVTMDAGSMIDVSGSQPVTTYVLDADESAVAQTVAGNPGSIAISANTLSLQGTLLGNANLAGLQGGSLSISSRTPLIRTLCRGRTSKTISTAGSIR